MMTSKEYYSLDELPKRFDVNLPSIKALIDQRKITPVVKLASTRLIIGGIDKDRRFVAYGVGTYKGMISIQRSQFSELWFEDSVNSNFLILHNSQNITEYSKANPFDVHLPSGLIHSWQATPLTEITRNKIIAICVPEYKSFKSIFRDNSFEESECSENLEGYASLQIDDDQPYSDYCWLAETKLSIELSEVVILHTDLVSSGAIKPSNGIEPPSKPHAVAISVKLKYANPFQTLIAKILQKHPEMTGKRIFRILSREAHTDIDAREFDTEGVLADEIDGVIFWNDSTRKTGFGRCSYSTLKNPVRDVRIVMNQKNC